MILQTASAVISFTKEIENGSAAFYEDLARRDTPDKDVFLSFVKENGKNVVQIERAYYGVITDALEGCFAFKMEADSYAVRPAPAGDASYSEALSRAAELEEQIIKFYQDAAEQSKSLMADVPRAFAMIAKKRNQRIEKLRQLLGSQSG